MNALDAFQLVVPRPLRELAAGRHRLEFISQAENAFIRTNRAEWLAELTRSRRR